MLQCKYSVKYHDYAPVNVFDIASPDVHKIIREYVSLEEASTIIDSEATKFIHELEDAGQRGAIDKTRDTVILIKYHEGEFDRYRRFYIEKRDDVDYDDNDIEQMLSSIKKIYK